jgi:DHA1 family chloramphenicol resistance protein-like MFS transporter
VNVHTAQQASTFPKRLPLGVYVLAFSLFAMGSAEFLVAGVLPAVADDQRISLSAAGALISRSRSVWSSAGRRWPS